MYVSYFDEEDVIEQRVDGALLAGKKIRAMTLLRAKPASFVAQSPEQICLYNCLTLLDARWQHHAGYHHPWHDSHADLTQTVPRVTSAAGQI